MAENLLRVDSKTWVPASLYFGGGDRIRNQPTRAVEVCAGEEKHHISHSDEGSSCCRNVNKSNKRL